MFIALAIGFTIAPTGETQVVEKEVIKEVSIANEADWKQLKEIDDQGFSYAAEGMSVCGETIKAAGNFDVKGIEAGTEKLVVLTEKVNLLANTRLMILEKLGY